MPSAVRLSDVCSGHGCFPSRPNVQASPDVIINGRGSHRLTDKWAVHCCLLCHASQAASGSPNVIVNNLNKCRIGDAVACGSTMVQGSPNVIVNG